MALVLYTFVAWLQWTDNDLYYDALTYIDGQENRHPFNDLYAILQAGTCWLQHVNVYVPSKCMNGGVFNYAPMLLRAGYFGLEPQQKNIVGLLIEISFLFSLSALPIVKSWQEFWFRNFAIISTTTIYALERANFDIVIFLIIMCGGWLIQRHALARIFAYTIFLFAAALKFYPIVLLITIVRERLIPVICLTLVVGVIVLLYVIYFAAETKSAVKIIPRPEPFAETFGAMDLPLGLSLLIRPSESVSGKLVAHYSVALQVLILLDFIKFGAIIIAAFIAGRYRLAIEILNKEQKINLILGALLIVGCFFEAENADYRGIFMFLALPGLYKMFDTETGQIKRTLFSLLLVIILLLWEGTIHHVGAYVVTVFFGSNTSISSQIVFWIVRELAWWWVILQLTAMLIAVLKTEFVRLLKESALLTNKIIQFQI